MTNYPFEYYVKLDSAVGSGDEDLQTDKLKPGWEYHVTNICAWEEGTGLPQCSLGYLSGSTFMLMKKDSVDSPFQTVNYVGDIILKETDRIMTRFNNTDATDTLHMYVNGWKRRRLLAP